MAGINKKTALKDLFFSKFTLVVLIAFSGYMAVSVYERYTVEREMSGRLDDTYSDYSKLEVRRDGLLERVEYLEGESGIESEIRKHFDVAREGEQVVIIVDEEEEDGPEFFEGSDPDVVDGKPWYQFW